MPHEELTHTVGLTIAGPAKSTEPPLQASCGEQSRQQPGVDTTIPPRTAGIPSVRSATILRHIGEVRR